MPNQIANISRSSDNFAIAASTAQSSAIVGERLRFTKGRYLVGRGAGEPFAATAPLQALDIQAAWVKFLGGQVVDQRVGYPLPEREDLDDLDDAQWPAGYDGRPADPWSNQRYLYLVDPQSGADYTFVTSSWSGRAAVEALARQVVIKRQTAPGAVALVRLEAGFKNSQSYGAIPCPKFVIAGWSGDEPRAPRSTAVNDLDDDIPF